MLACLKRHDARKHARLKGWVVAARLKAEVAEEQTRLSQQRASVMTVALEEQARTEEVVTVCVGGCNPTRWSLLPYMMEAETLCG